jgi:hypothetical protein
MNINSNQIQHALQPVPPQYQPMPLPAQEYQFLAQPMQPMQPLQPYYDPNYTPLPPPQSAPKPLPPQSIIPPPPAADMPPPPPPPSSDSNNETEEYDPSEAMDKEAEQEMLLEKAKQKQQDIDNIVKNKQKAELDHIKRMEAENKKLEDIRKRKQAGAFGPIKLKKTKLKGFGFNADDDDEEDTNEGSKKKQEQKDEKEKSLQIQKKTLESNATKISPEQMKFITQTATYLLTNKNQAADFLKTRRTSKQYEFLYDPERTSLEGKFYREIYEQLRAEKEVRDITNDEVKNSFVNNQNRTMAYNNNYSITGSSTYTVTPMAVPDVDYSDLNPFADEESNQSTSSKRNGSKLSQSTLAPPATYKEVMKSDEDEALHQMALQELQQYRNTKYITTHTVVNNTPAISSSSAAAIVANLVKNFPIELASSAEEGTEQPKTTRKSRWGTSATQVQPQLVDIPLEQAVVVKEKTVEEKAEEEYERARDIRFAAQVKEQKEMQLLEGRIRDAAARSVGGLTSSSGTKGANYDGASAKQQELYDERLLEYQILAKRYDEDEARDTIDDAERNGGGLSILLREFDCMYIYTHIYAYIHIFDSMYSYTYIHVNVNVHSYIY